MKSYIKKELSEITGLNPRLIQFYTDEGLITPEVDKGAGRGKVRRYSVKNLLEFAIIKELNDYGLNISALKQIFVFVSNHLASDHLKTIVEYPKLKLIITKDEVDKLKVYVGVNYNVSENHSFKFPDEILEIDDDGQVIGKSPTQLVMREYVSFMFVDILAVYNKTIGKIH
jgi:DNA-binding transcriptional MerR regulator